MSLKKSFFSALLMISIFGSLFVFTVPVSAAPAICYYQGSGGSDSYGDGGLATRVIGCNSPTIRMLLPTLTTPGGIRPDNCYVAGGVTLAVYEMPSPQCSRLRQLANDTPAGPDDSPGGSRGDGESPDSLQTEDIFGTSREELQTCSGAECVNNNPLTKIAIYAVNIMGALVGVIAVAMIVLAGIQYSSSGGNPQTTAEAKKRIINVVIALAAFFFLWAFMQWVIPGGALNG